MTTYELLLLAARIVLGLVFLLPRVQAHLMHRAQTVAVARVKGVPLRGLFVPLAGVCLIAGGLMVTMGAWVDLGAATPGLVFVVGRSVDACVLA